MAAHRASPGRRLLAYWRRLAWLPGGTWLFSRLLARMVPYTGSIDPRVEALEPGYARVHMQDRRAVRNHLDSIHAVALVNLAEVTSGLALAVALPPGARAILTGFSITYLKKARGTLIAECRAATPSAEERGEHVAIAEIRDASGEVVARAEASWLVGPAQAAEAGGAATTGPPGAIG